MRISGFEYHAPASLSEALGMMDQYGSEAKPLAGGTDLLLDMKHGLKPKHLVGLGGLEQLKEIGLDDSEIRIGALCPLTQVAENQALQASIPVLTHAVSLIGSWQIRNVGTLGGNLCHASPAADSAGPLLALGASLELASSSGTRVVALSDFFTGPGQSVRQPKELLTTVVIPRSQTKAAGRYLKLMRRKAVDLALLGVAVQISLNEDQTTIQRTAIGLGGLAPTPVRARKAEALLNGLNLPEAKSAIPDSVASALTAIKPIDDVRATASYRRTVTQAYLRKGLESALAELSGKGAAS